MKNKLNLGLIVLFLSIFCVRAQENRDYNLIWNIDYKFMFDNREFSNNANNYSFTYFGNIVAPELGIQIDSKNTLYAAVDIERYFGKKTTKDDYNFLAYYEHVGEHFKADVGFFHRDKYKGTFPSAFFDDSLLFYDNAVEGALFQYVEKTWYLELGIDWFGYVYKDSRERFQILSSGRKDLGPFYGEYNFMMYHYAGSEVVRGVVDNFWFYPRVGIDFTQWWPFQAFDLKLGYLQSLQCNRHESSKYKRPGGFQAEIDIRKWNFGIDNTLFIGDNMNPFYHSLDKAGAEYGRDLYMGNLFYGADNGMYNRLEFYYEPVQKQWLHFRISSIHHYDGKDWGSEQKATVYIKFGGDFKGHRRYGDNKKNW